MKMTTVRMTFLFVASLISLVQLGTAAQGSNYNVTESFAEAHSCDSKCQDALNNANPIDLSTFGENFDFDFYETAANFSGSKPGDLLKLQPLDPAALQINAGTTVYRIQYTSRDLDGSPVPATGFIALPYAPAKQNSSTYPVVAYAHGTSGIYRGCAPSNSPNLYDYNSWQLLIERGYAVVATDYAGLGNSYTLHKYISYPAQVNDIIIGGARLRLHHIVVLAKLASRRDFPSSSTFPGGYNRPDDLFSNDCLALLICRNFFGDKLVGVGRKKKIQNQKKGFTTTCPILQDS
jgi:hypothetical protein